MFSDNDSGFVPPKLCTDGKEGSTRTGYIAALPAVFAARMLHCIILRLLVVENSTVYWPLGWP
jgi:hypothetical protein